VAHVAGAVFVGGTSRASTNPVHVLVAFGRVLGEIDPSAKHAADVCVPLVEALVDDGVDEGGTWQEKGHIPITSIARQKEATYSNVGTCALPVWSFPSPLWALGKPPQHIFVCFRLGVIRHPGHAQTIQPSLPTPPSAYWLAAPSPFRLHRGSYDNTNEALQVALRVDLQLR